MNKDSLLEVDFEHLAWKPVAHKILKSLPGSLKPLEMSRGKNDVYLKAEWVADTPEQVKDIQDFKQIFNEISDRRGDDGEVSDTFLPLSKDFGKESSAKTDKVAETPEPKETVVEDKPDSEKSIDELIKELGLDDASDIEDIDLDNIPDEILDAEKVDYVPNEKYNYYVINKESKNIDSGWAEEGSAKNRLASIESNGAEDYSVEKYGTKLFKLVGDPTTIDWNPYGSYNFYVYDSTNDTIDSGFDDEEGAKTRIKEIKDILNDYSELDETYEIIEKDKALEKLGLGITSEVTWVPIEEMVKKVDRIRSDALMESVLTELENPSAKEALGKLYIMFKFGPDYDPTDTSNRNGSSEEYFERDVFLDKLVSEDGSLQITSKELKKAADNLGLERPYQKLVKLINHTSDYYYNNLGFNKKPIDVKKGYSQTADEIDNSPKPELANQYLNAISDIGAELKSKSGDSTAALAALGIAFRELNREDAEISNKINEIVNSGESSEEIASNEILKKIQSLIIEKWQGATQKQLLSTLDKIIVPYVLELNDDNESNTIYKAIYKMLLTNTADNERISNNPFAKVNEVDPTNVGKAKKANIPTADVMGAAGLPILFNKKLKEYNAKVAQAIASVQEDKKLARDYYAANGSQKKKIVADQYQKLFGTVMSNDFKDIRDEHKSNVLGSANMKNGGYNYQTVRK